MKRLFAAMLATGLLLSELLNPLTTYATEVTSETEVAETVTEEVTESDTDVVEEDASDTSVEETVAENGETAEETVPATESAGGENSLENTSGTADGSGETDLSNETQQGDSADGTLSEETSSADSNTVTTEASATGNTADAVDSASEDADSLEDAEEIVYTEDTTSLQYVVVVNPEVEQNQEETILLGLDSSKTYENAVLRLENTNSKTVYELKNYSVEEEGITFTSPFAEGGQYALSTLTYEVKNGDDTSYYEINFKNLGVNAGFAVDASSKFESDAVLEDEDAEELSAENAEFVVTDMTGDSSSISDVTEALENADEETTGVTTSKAEISDTLNKLTGTITANAASNIVVVLDPGHGGLDSGACAYGLQEKNLTLSIAKYCKAELEKYAGVKVYMTRSSDSQAGITYDGSSVPSTGASLTKRVEYARSVGANYFISIHINSGVATASGAEVWYPNGNYNATNAANGKGVAQAIENQLVALGLVNRGIKIRNSENGSTYPDGSLRDYYSVIAGSMESGFPGIIVEHAFVSNASDVSNYLNSEAKLKKLGVADATGIAKYLNLKKKGNFKKVSITSIKASGFNNVKLEWGAVSNATGYNVYRAVLFGEYEKIGSTTKTSYTDKTGKTGTLYFYAIAPYDSKYEGDLGEGKSVTTKESQVKNVTVKNSTFNANKVSWDKVSGASGYMVYRREGTSGSFTLLTPFGTTDLSYKDNTAQCGKTYQYRVRAFRNVSNKTIYGKYSSKKKITSNARKVTYTEKETNGLHRTAITWKAVSGATAYRVYRKAEGESKWTVVKESTTSLTYTDNNVSAGKVYKYKVKAYRTYKKKNYWGTAKTIKVTAGYGKTTVTSVKTGEFNDLIIKWKKISGASTYIIQRREVTLLGKGSWETVAEGVKGKTYTDSTAKCGKTYQYRVKSVRTYKKKTYKGKYSSASSKKEAANGAVTAKKVSVADSGLKVTWTKLSSVTGYTVYRKAEGELSYTKIGTTKKTNYTDSSVTSNTKYSYKVTAYRTVNKKKYSSSVKSNAVSGTAGYTILGSSNVTVAQMVKYYENSGKSYPASVYVNYGAPTLNDFCTIVYDVSNSYGVRAEVVWAQICKETGYLQFGGLVQATDCNFAGLGATGAYDANGQPVRNIFSSVTEGVTAQVQHLKLYASADTSWSKSVAIVDQRFYTSVAGKAPYVEWLGISTNPYGSGWATAADYSESLLKYIWALRNTKA